jgi:hypothetical protein
MTLHLLAERQAVVDVIVRFLGALDQQDWAAVRACLTDEIETDYSSFRGTPPARLTAEEFIRLRQTGLAGLTTQHVTVGHQTEVVDGSAECRCEFIIHRWPSDPADQRFLHSYGHYIYSLRSFQGNWRIIGITQVVRRSEGDRQLHGALSSKAGG